MWNLSVDQALIKAHAFARNGNIAEARKLYQFVLSCDAGNQAARHGLAALAAKPAAMPANGAINQQMQQLKMLYDGQQHDAVLTLARTLVKQHPKMVLLWEIIGTTCVRLAHFSDAEEAFKSVTRLNPRQPEGFVNLGHACRQQGKTAEAVAAYQAALGLNPKIAPVHHALGLTLLDAGQFDAAAAAFDQVLALSPDHADAAFNLGKARAGLGQHDAAITALQESVRIKPDFTQAWNNLGNALVHDGRLDEALEAFDQAIALKPDYAEAFFNKGNAFTKLGRRDTAITALQESVRIKPDFTQAWNNLGNALVHDGRFDEALKAFDEAIAISPDYAEAYNNTGLIHVTLGQRQEAIAAFTRSIDLNPHDVEAKLNLGFEYLKQRKFPEGFDLYEHRLETHDISAKNIRSLKPWSGEENQNLLVLAEQGIGDEVMFSSIIPELYARTAALTVECDPRLIPLFRRSFPAGITYLEKGQPFAEDDYDGFIPMGSLPRYFRQSEEDFRKTAGGFLMADEARIRHFRDQLAEADTTQVIGISWMSKSKAYGGHYKSLPLADLARAVAGPTVRLVNLQYGDVAADIAQVREAHKIDITEVPGVDIREDIDDLSALIMACDRVVSVSNVTIHLAGALGRKTQIMLPKSHDWRWGSDGRDSYWYDAVDLYKQPALNNWDAVLKAVAADLA
ncbi:MAG: tetratricopeptide repeat protein [Candidatus Puniceispirillales bacterium]